MNLGRTRANKLQADMTRNPSCSAFFQGVAQAKDWQGTIRALEANMLFCKPCIDINGDVVIGESVSDCQKLGTVFENVDDLYKRTHRMKCCDKCGHFSTGNRRQILVDIFAKWGKA